MEHPHLRPQTSTEHILRHHTEAKEVNELRRVFDTIDKKGDNKLDAEELLACFRFLGHKSSEAEVAEIIWEVDEDLDQSIGWEEYRRMYQRVRRDDSGKEPRRMFNLIEFMLHDRDNSGTIDTDECMDIFFRRFGMAKMDSKLKQASRLGEREGHSADDVLQRQTTYTEFLAWAKRKNGPLGL